MGASPNAAWTWRERLQNPKHFPSLHPQAKTPTHPGAGLRNRPMDRGRGLPETGSSLAGSGYQRSPHVARCQTSGSPWPKQRGFLRTRLEDIELYFGEGRFPKYGSPFQIPNPAKAVKKRLTSPAFLKRYRKVLQEGATFISKPIIPLCLNTPWKPGKITV